jgi:hypothetical protein
VQVFMFVIILLFIMHILIHLLKQSVYYLLFFGQLMDIFFLSFCCESLKQMGYLEVE